jgi:mannose-1-phosphate guanylyltransferase
MAETSAPPMKAIVFAGGVGTRMWPLSRKKSPKQFEPVIDQQSTLQLAVSRLTPEFSPEDIYISTGEQYRSIIQNQLPTIPKSNIIGEPEMRDVGPAVGYLLSIIAKTDADSPVAILWSDHQVENIDTFKKALLCGGTYLAKHPDKFVFIGQRPRFANQNLGWIEYGDTIDTVNGFDLKSFASWHYRPDLDTAKQYFRDRKHAWNPGYFMVTPRVVLDHFKTIAPDMYAKLYTLQQSYGQPHHQAELAAIYPTLEKISFDDLILSKVKPEEAVVISVDMGWSDVGTWDALKEAMQTHPQDNLTHGLVKTMHTTNSLVYSYTDQLVAAIDLDDMVVVVTPDAVLVTKQKSIPKIKELLKTFEGTKLEKYT